MELGYQPFLPDVLIVERDIDDVVIVRRSLDAWRHQRAHSIDSELADEEAELEDHVLTRPGLGRRRPPAEAQGVSRLQIDVA